MRERSDIRATLFATGQKLIEFVINNRIQRPSAIAIKLENRVAPVTVTAAALPEALSGALAERPLTGDNFQK
jgi:hypothetical protein